ncbi:hypothetical protein LO772_25250 [Yinghuangia sp. ASG 101]|nr:hypothetical protein [Yinghuangia sp. ASG 101]UGQ10163.1 hypothetical protein LO772_25250 [Yinghuangia sp. ASG 101]
MTAGGVDVTVSGDRVRAEPTAATVAWSITAGHPLPDRRRAPIGGAA